MSGNVVQLHSTVLAQPYWGFARVDILLDLSMLTKTHFVYILYPCRKQQWILIWTDTCSANSTTHMQLGKLRLNPDI